MNIISEDGANDGLYKAISRILVRELEIELIRGSRLTDTDYVPNPPTNHNPPPIVISNKGHGWYRKFEKRNKRKNF